MSILTPSITYLIASTGRETLKDTLRSLHGQFMKGVDKIKIYFDGRCDKGADFFQEEWDLFGDDLHYEILPETLGYWGHGIRNKYQTACITDYIHHMDDDDIYCEGCIPRARGALVNHYGKILICKFRTLGNAVIWSRKNLAFGQIGTPSGFIFNRPEIMGTWGLGYGGDYNFYKEVQDKIGKENIVFYDLLIVKTRPTIYGY